MSAASPLSFWAIAITGSLALHGAVGMGLYAMPMPEPKVEAQTEITISAPDAGVDMSQPQSETIAARAAEEASAVAGPSSPALVAKDASEIAGKPQTAALEAVKDTATVGPQDVTPSEPQQVTPSALSAAADEKQVVAALEESEAASPSSESALLEASNAAPVIADEKPAAEALAATDDSAPVADSVVPATQLDDQRPATEAAPVFAPDTAVVPSDPSEAIPFTDNPNVAIPAIAPVQESAQPLSEPVPSAPTSNQRVALNAGTVSPVVDAAKPSANDSDVVPLAPAKPPSLTPNVSSALRPALSASQSVSGSEVVTAAPSTEAAVVGQSGGEEEAVAMLPLQDLAPDDLAIPDSSGMRVEDFLAESGDGSCLLALPLDPMQATVEAYSDSPDAVHELGAEFMRVAGLDLKTEMRPVSKNQCGALSFARSLPTYPNFPLQMTLDHRAIASGQALSGVVSGLRKDTLYLMVVDNDGKAELVSSSTIGDVRSVEFSEAMTLTGKSGSAVQLLIAIASDGPLRNLPRKPGMPASEYFSKLTFEIIGDNRSIAYGITSFVVR